jgi:cysteinyl-tRNA synthetase
MFHVLGLDIKYVEMTKEDLDLYNSYLQAKFSQNYDESDKIRQKLSEKGIM